MHDLSHFDYCQRVLI